MHSYVASKLKDICQVQLYVGLNAASETGCFNVSGAASALGVPIKWDVIHYNEGLHSLWPRVNTSAELAQWGRELGAFTDLLKQVTGAKLIYATMTPFMPEKYLNPPGAQNDVETKNALAVKTTKEHGVNAINDLYSIITAHCGKTYKDCDICDDESKYHPEGKCGYHYVTNGWDLLANATAAAIRMQLSQLEEDKATQCSQLSHSCSACEAAHSTDPTPNCTWCNTTGRGPGPAGPTGFCRNVATPADCILTNPAACANNASEVVFARAVGVLH
jgi:hypothetical protein